MYCFVCREALSKEVEALLTHLTSQMGGDKLVLLTGVRKGRTLLARLLALLSKERAVTVHQDLCTYLPVIAKQDAKQDVRRISPSLTVSN